LQSSNKGKNLGLITPLPRVDKLSSGHFPSGVS
jgi:hypothetical protein